MDLIDTAIDRSIALGYGRPGIWLRRRLPGWPPNIDSMQGKTVLVTGAASGIGLAAARELARLGARVLAVARSPERASEAAELIGGTNVRPLACDISDLRALRQLARSLAETEPRLDVLINNAGVMPAERQRSVDGHELTFATHVLAPFALTAWCRDQLAGSATGRIINVSSGGMYTQSVPCDDFESEHEDYSPTRFYAATKREEVVISEMWAERLRETGIVVHSMHPGWADTKGVRDALPRFRALTRGLIRTPEEAADTIVWLAASPEAAARTGCFWHDRRPRPTRYRLGAGDETAACHQRLWDYCESIIRSVGP